MKNLDSIVKKYIQIKKTNGLSYAQLRERLKHDRLQKYQINRIIDEIYQQQESNRIGYHNKINMIYPFAFGLILIGASIYFYQLSGGINLILKTKGIGWSEYRYLIGTLILLATGTSLILYGWIQQKE